LLSNVPHGEFYCISVNVTSPGSRTHIGLNLQCSNQMVLPGFLYGDDHDIFCERMDYVIKYAYNAYEMM
jgi:hypothetical protein